MIPDQMRIAIAEDQGWKLNYCRERNQDCVTVIQPDGKHCSEWPVVLRDNAWLGYIPNYTEDLNAILPLLPEGALVRRYEFDWVVCAANPEILGHISAYNQSPALAICEFYLKWKGLWQEDPERRTG